MYRKYLFSFVFLALASSCPPAAAHERIGAFLIPDNMQDAILLVDDITMSTPAEFRRALKAQKGAKILVLGSNGGVLSAAIELARQVRSNGMSTVVPPQFGCFSACAYVYFAGREHAIGGELGVHRASTGHAADAASAAAYFDSVRGELASLDVPDAVMDRAGATPSETMHVFTQKEIKALSLNKTSGPKSRVAILARH